MPIPDYIIGIHKKSDQTMKLVTFTICAICLGALAMSAQVDTIPPVPDTTQIRTDTLAPLATPAQDTVKKEKAKRPPYDKFKILAGVSLSSLSTDEANYTSDSELGYLLGASYQRGRFVYWELGAQFNNAVVELRDPRSTSTDGTSFRLRSIDVPVSVGINVLSFIDRIVGIRVYGGVTPSFIIDVGDNDVGVTDDNTRSFNPYAHVGVGVNVLFIFVEATYKYGFNSAFDLGDSEPRQFHVTLGFRF